MSEEEIKSAEFEVDRARTRLIATMNELLGQFEPHRLIQDVWEKAKDKGADLAEDAVDAVRARPLAATGVVAAITMFLAREPLMDLAAKAVGGKKSRKRRKAKAEAAPKEEKTEAS
jgi:hypothetical protein